MGRRPKSIGVENAETPTREHPELSLDPQCMHTGPFCSCPVTYWDFESYSFTFDVANQRGGAHLPDVEMKTGVLPAGVVNGGYQDTHEILGTRPIRKVADAHFEKSLKLTRACRSAS